MAPAEYQAATIYIDNAASSPIPIVKLPCIKEVHKLASNKSLTTKSEDSLNIAQAVSGSISNYSEMDVKLDNMNLGILDLTSPCQVAFLNGKSNAIITVMEDEPAHCALKEGR